MRTQWGTADRFSRSIRIPWQKYGLTALCLLVIGCSGDATQKPEPASGDCDLSAFADADGDGFGDASDARTVCAVEAGVSARSGDCDDDNPNVNPDAAETCDGLDNDCDGQVDPDSAQGTSMFFRDVDADGWGDGTDSVAACTVPDGFVDLEGDCADTDPLRNPEASEECDGGDNNCDGLTDEEDPFVVCNSPPSLLGASLSPEPAYAGDSVLCSPVGWSDADGDPERVSVQWELNFELSLDVDEIFDASITGGDVLVCTLTPLDDSGAGESVFSILTVSNSPPSEAGVGITPERPREGVDGLVCVIDAPATDPDGDSLSYSVVWEVDGVPYGGAAATTTLVGDTIPSGVVVGGEVWTCGVTAFDGAESGLEVRAEVEIVPPCDTGVVEVVTSSGLQFKRVCAQTFDQGCTPGQVATGSCEFDESPVRPVTLSRDFLVGTTEVTQGQFLAMMGYNPTGYTGWGTSAAVSDVHWHMAAAFSNALSTAEGLAGCYSCSGSGTGVRCTAPADPYACDGYRLPMEAEWEAAARCGSDQAWAGSSSPGAVGWYSGNSGARVHAVGGLATNACGLYDMSGNVSEWTNDLYGGYAAGAVTDPYSTSGSYMVIRGGSYYHDYHIMRVSDRWWSDLTYQHASLGFRVFRTMP
jgi:formylglycine-generating enzyme required for sulfatase activity